MGNNSPNRITIRKSITIHLAIDMVESSLGLDTKEKVYNNFHNV